MAESGQPGRDYEFNITVKNPDGTAKDLTSVNGFALVAYIQPNEVVAQWSINTVDDFLPINEVDFSAGQINIKLPAINTAEKDNVMIYIEAIEQVNGSTNMYIGNQGGEFIELIQLTSSAKITIPDLNP